MSTSSGVVKNPLPEKVLDTLRQECNIPVWHDDAQGTGCVTLAGRINALKVAGKDMAAAKIVFWDAGASNITIFRLIVAAGGDPKNVIMFDTRGSRHQGRDDIKADARFYRKGEICKASNPKGVTDILDAIKGADALIALSTPGPDVVKPEWIRAMTPKSIIFACAKRSAAGRRRQTPGHSGGQNHSGPAHKGYKVKHSPSKGSKEV
ncbi:NADP-dependent malic enzyme [candidate division TA06 bacterium]|uniref:NADP-dependent malic enzyme n=1 Tax=candidate division TA06 bacterium TaxID=2250710 RepID=A0A933I753_UNCT6|nr:NADP-dependent malic enzyme [candidate division TA06 bacterium]